MRTLTVAGIALSVAVSPVATPAAPAGPPPGAPEGIYCGITDWPDPTPTADQGDMVGEVDAGPATTGVPGTLVCTVQVGSNVHSAPDTAVHEFADVNGVIAGVQPLRYRKDPDAEDFLCTSFRRADGTTIYFTSGRTGHWHTDPDGPCRGPVDNSAGNPFEWLDHLGCPVLAERKGSGNGVLVDHEGDVFVDTGQDGGTTEADAMAELFYDCPVYAFSHQPGVNPDALHDAVTDTASTTPKVVD